MPSSGSSTPRSASSTSSLLAIATSLVPGYHAAPAAPERAPWRTEEGRREGTAGGSRSRNHRRRGGAVRGGAADDAAAGPVAPAEGDAGALDEARAQAPGLGPAR